MKQRTDRFSGNNRHYINRQIRAQQVLCIDDQNVNHGVLSLVDALRMADTRGLDLVQISTDGKTPTCKILDYSKFKYELAKKDKLARKKQRESVSKVKEIKFRPSTDDNDLRTKAKQASEFIAEGHKVKITIVFKGRELSHKDIASNTLDKFMGMIPGAELISPPNLTGRNLSVMAGKKMMRERLENAS